MKRIICMLMVLAFAFAVTACAPENQGSAESTTKSTISQSTGETKTTNATTAPAEITAAPTEDAQIEEVSVSERVVYEGDDFKVTLKGYDNTDINHVKFDFLLENYTKKNIVLSANNFVVNGIYVRGNLYMNAAAEKKANGSLEIDRDDLSFAGIDNIATLYTNDVEIYDSDSYDGLINFEIDISTSISEGYIQEIDENGDLLYESDGITIKYKGFSKDRYGRPQLLFFIKNNTNKNLYVTCENVSVNDFTLYGNLYAYCLANTVCYEYMEFSSSDLEENKITDFEKVSFSFESYEQETYEDVFQTDTFEILISESVPKEATTSIESVVEALKRSLSSYPNLSIEQEDGVVIITYWVPGLEDSVASASSGDSGKLTAWNAFIESELSQYSLTAEAFKIAGYGDAIITWSVLNDVSPDSVLLSIVDGEVVYNAADK